MQLSGGRSCPRTCRGRCGTISCWTRQRRYAARYVAAFQAKLAAAEKEYEKVHAEVGDRDTDSASERYCCFTCLRAVRMF